MKDKQSVAVKLYDLKNRERLIKSLSIAPASFDRWVSTKAKQMKESLNETIILEYLKAENTQQMVADNLGVGRSTITELVGNTQVSVPDNFQPFLYNIWNTSKENNLLV